MTTTLPSSTTHLFKSLFINRFVGMRDAFTADTALCHLSHRDMIVFCSDGLTDVLTVRRTAGILQEYLPRQAGDGTAGVAVPARRVTRAALLLPNFNQDSKSA